MGNLDAYERDTFTWAGKQRDVFRRGSGPAVIVLAEMPGITPKVIEFADRVVDLGCTAVLPHLFGVPGAPVTVMNTVRAIGPACVSKEFSAWATGKTSPVVEWCKALARHEHERLGGPGVGVVGMCFTGNFALAMLPDPSVVAPVLSQPSLPLGFTKKARRRALPERRGPGQGAGAHGGRARPVRARPALLRGQLVPKERFAPLCVRRWATASWRWRSTPLPATRTATRSSPTQSSPSTSSTSPAIPPAMRFEQVLEPVPLPVAPDRLIPHQASDGRRHLGVVAADVAAGVRQRVVEVVEQVVLVGQVVEGADGPRGSRRCSGRGPFSSTVMPRPSSSATISPSACAPVASSTCTSGSRRITTLTSVTAVSSVRNRWAAPKNSAPSRR